MQGRSHDPEDGVRDIRGMAVVVALACAGSLVAWELGPWPHTVQSPTADVALETTAALCALLFAYLLLGRFRASRGLTDLALAASIGLLGAGHLLYQMVPAALSDGTAPAWAAWAAMATHLSAAVVYFGAALAGERSVTRPMARRAGAGCALVLAGAGAGALLLVPEGAAQPGAGTAGAVINALGAAAFAAVAVVFARAAVRRRDELLGWLAIATVFAAAARVGYLLHPTLYTPGVGIGDAFRLLDHIALVVGALREISRFWRGLAAAAVARERRRIARDFHDGLAQELAYIARRSDTAGPEIGDAARRALADARRAIAALRDDDEDDLATALETAAVRAARDSGATVEVDVAAGSTAAPRERDELGRIVGEAVSNAVRHGRARHIRIELPPGGPLRIRDDGSGFDVDAPGAGGYGLTGMAERAAAVGRELVVRSGDGGTEIEVRP